MAKREWLWTDPQEEILAEWRMVGSPPWDLIARHAAKQALDQTGHAGIGLPSGLLAGAGSVWLAPSWGGWLAVAIGAAALSLAIREAVQLAKSGQPHLVDRILDVAGGAAGGAIGYVLLRALAL